MVARLFSCVIQCGMLCTSHKVIVVFCCMQMQMRFDGLFGFPGGFIDSTDPSIVYGLNRELIEEINLDVDKHRVTQDNFVMSCVCSHRKMVTHFYAIEVTVAEYEEIEKRVIAAHDWGSEVRQFHRIILCICYSRNTR